MIDRKDKENEKYNKKLHALYDALDAFPYKSIGEFNI